MKLKLGTRGSKLALWQAEYVKSLILQKFPAHEVEIVTLVSSGDLKQGTPLAGKGDKKDWIVGLEDKLLTGEVDLTVNSSKDVPHDLISNTELLPISKREYPLDVFVTKDPDIKSLSEIPLGSKIGAASLRRRSVLRSVRPDLELVEVRGNVNTRLEKLASDPTLSGLVLARAGLERLGVTRQCSFFEFTEQELIPAMNQGILAAQFKSDREDIRELLVSMICKDTYAAWVAEREVIRLIGADCRSSVGVFGKVSGAELSVKCIVLSLDGKQHVAREIKGAAIDALQLGKDLAAALLLENVQELLR